MKDGMIELSDFKKDIGFGEYQRVPIAELENQDVIIVDYDERMGEYGEYFVVLLERPALKDKVVIFVSSEAIKEKVEYAWKNEKLPFHCRVVKVPSKSKKSMSYFDLV